MNDTQRLDWLEREPWRLLCRTVDGDGYKFKVVIGKHASASFSEESFSEEYETLREAIDKGMKGIL